MAWSLGGAKQPVEHVAELLAGVCGFQPDLLELGYGAWDPPTAEEHIEASRCRAFLLEIVRRAAHDWILYRTHDRLQLRRIAEDAYIWLFEESPSHPWTRIRNANGTNLTSFLTICDLLELDPKFVRERIRSMTVKQIMTAGRPSERRRHLVDESCVEHSTEVDLVGLESSIDCSSCYEAHFLLGQK